MTKLNRFIWFFIAINGAFAVLFSAWLAHAGVNLVENARHSLQQAIQFQFFHTLALLVLQLAGQQLNSNWINAAKLSFVVGIICFSGGIYLKYCLNLLFIAHIVPFGGVSFAVGWVMLAGIGFKKV